MVHALHEAHRLLNHNGILIDLRPAPEHRQLGLAEGRRWRLVGPLHELLDDDYAADAAVAHVLREGIFRRERRLQFQLDRVMDTMEDVREWLADFDQRRNLRSHAALLKRLQSRRARLQSADKITVRGPLKLAVLRKLDSEHHRSRYGGHMILAILPDTSNIETLLNNLSEADFDLNDVSVMLKDTDLKNKIAQDVGPLQGIQPAQISGALQKAGTNQANAKRCQDAIAKGKAVIAMKVDPKYSQAARQMFTDHAAEIIQ